MASQLRFEGESSPKTFDSAAVLLRQGSKGFVKEKLIPGALFHCGANKLTDQSQKLFSVARMKLLQQGQEPQYQRWPVDGISWLPTNHP